MAVIQVIVQVSSDVAHELHIGESNTSEELRKMAKKLDISLKPMHPDSKDLLLEQYFIVEISETLSVEQVIKLLRQCKAVEAAYIKPPDELP